MNFDAIYTDPSLMSKTQSAKDDNQIKYLENLYSSGTAGQKVWAREELKVNYAIDKPKVTTQTTVSKPVETMVTSGSNVTPNTVILTSSGNTVESGQADVIKSNPLILLIIGVITLLVVAK